MNRRVGLRRLASACSLVSISSLLALGAWSDPASAQRPRRPAAPPAAPSEIEVVQLRDNFYVIGGAGGNIVVQIGPEGVILVDSGSTARAEEVLAAIRKITPLPIRYIINTSMDPDHTGGNEVLSKAGLSILPGAVAAGAGLGDDVLANFGYASIFAHENVLSRMTAADPPIPSVFYPTKTFYYRMYSMYLNGEGIQIIHAPAAHTDGDVIVFFRRGDVIATGDLIDTTRFPVIDVNRGGSLQGVLDGLNKLMDLSIHNVPLLWYPDRTFLVPGHGHVYDKLDLLEYRDAITTIRDRVQNLIDQGMTLAQVQAANPTLGYRSQYGTDSGPWTTEMFVAAIYNELTAKKSQR